LSKTTRWKLTANGVNLDGVDEQSSGKRQVNWGHHPDPPSGSSFSNAWDMRQPARSVDERDSQGEEASSDDIISDTNRKCGDSDSGVQEFETMLKI
jgi:hypothetical protein